MYTLETVIVVMIIKYFKTTILQANNKEIHGLSREEAVTYLTSLEGQVQMQVHYKKEGIFIIYIYIKSKNLKLFFKCI